MHVRAARIEFNSGLGNAGHVLCGLVRSMRPDVCVEIGSARGKSACYIGMTLKENRRGLLYAIDPHRSTAWHDDIDTVESFRANVSTLGLSEQVIMMRSTSEEAARDWHHPIDLIFIDGDHSYAGVRRDWDLFARHVKPFGIVVLRSGSRPPAPYASGHRPSRQKHAMPRAPQRVAEAPVVRCSHRNPGR
jgi:predicted O-methyltransferase YrrM